MSRAFYVVSVPLVIVRNYLVNAPDETAAVAAINRAPREWFSHCMHSERLIGLLETTDGVQTKATALTDLNLDGSEPDPDLGVLS